LQFAQDDRFIATIEKQASAHTTESGIAALTERAQSDGTPLPAERQFVETGHSEATHVRLA
jgi:transglutaminase/protease-like cytokinesis protein 3